MQLRNTQISFGSITKLFHWVNVVLIITMLSVGFIMVRMPDTMDKLRLIGLHKATGVTVMLLATCWILWRMNNVKPPYPVAMKTWQKIAADTSKYILLTMLFAMPLSGWVMSSAAGYPVSYYGWFVLPPLVGQDKALASTMADLHLLFALLIIAIMSLHASAALLHHFYYKDNVLLRMLPFIRKDVHVQDSDTHTGC